MTGVEAGVVLPPEDSIKMTYLGKILREESPYIHREDFRTCVIPKHEELQLKNMMCFAEEHGILDYIPKLGEDCHRLDRSFVANVSLQSF